MNKNLIIRADADTSVGTGHIMRCIALAQAWQDKRGDVTFLSHCDSKTLRKRIIDEGFDFIPIEKPCPDPDDLTQTLNVLKRLALCALRSAPCWFALDGYHFTPDYQKAIRDNGYKLLVIDDMAHLDHYHADILLNQNIHASSLHYSCERDTVKLLGCEYVLLRREFLKYKDWKRKIPEKAKKILVTMGGGDPDNVTLKIIEALKLLDESDILVKIIIGPANPHLETLRKALAAAHFIAELLINPANMPDLMAWSDLAISAGGSTCWEMAFLGLPFLTIVLADNQAGITRNLYEDALCYEFDLLKFLYRRQIDLDVQYKDVVFKHRFKADLIVDEKVLIENKAIKKLTNQDEAQLINYLKTTGIRVGLLFNFGAEKFEMLRRIF